MGNLARYTAADLPALMERINRNSIGMDEYFDRLFNLHETTKNYPPFNLVTVSAVESRLELALAGFRKDVCGDLYNYFGIKIEAEHHQHMKPK